MSMTSPVDDHAIDAATPTSTSTVSSRSASTEPAIAATELTEPSLAVSVASQSTIATRLGFVASGTPSGRSDERRGKACKR